MKLKNWKEKQKVEEKIMQPFPNPNYYAQYQQQFNPYMQRMENLQQFQQAINQPQVATPMQMPSQQLNPLGKIVESIDIVKVTDIPMDGNMYYFPKADGTEIYSKQFMPNGQTRILTFKPLLDSEPNNLSLEEEKSKFEPINNVLRDIQEDIKALTDKVDKISKPTTSRSKKEVADDAE